MANKKGKKDRIILAFGHVMPSMIGFKNRQDWQEVSVALYQSKDIFGVPMEKFRLVLERIR